MQRIAKAYGGVQALVRASLVCFPGEVHGLIGQNGAGKSTLIKIVSGVVQPDSGEIFHHEVPVNIRSPRDAWANGIGTVFQELSLIGDLTVAMNLLYDSPEISRWGHINVRRLNELARERLASIGLSELNPTSLVRQLTLSDRQSLEIAKVISRNPTLLVLDEATSALHSSRVEWLREQVSAFVSQGRAVVFVSHRMQEVTSFSDRLTVFRGGEDVGSGLASEFPHDDLIELMLGRRIDSSFPVKSPSSVAAKPKLEVRGLAAGKQLSAVDLDLYSGQILGIGGLQGQGQQDLFLALYGARAMSGAVTINGREVKVRSPSDARRAGIAFVPEDRATEGLFQTLSVRDNIVLGDLERASRFGLIAGVSPRRLVERMIKLLQIKLTSPYQEVRGLSGGNQQKVLLARALSPDPDVVLMYDPTRGVDVGTKTEIYKMMRDLCGRGVAILFFSSDAAELAGVSDRVLVLHDGRIGAELAGAELTEETIVRAMVGQSGAQSCGLFQQ